MSEVQEQSTGNYNSIKEDPESLLVFVDKYVELNLIKNRSYSGFVNSIDPITYSIILSVPHEDNYQSTIIPGHAILNISEVTPPENTKPPVRKQITDEPGPDILERKRKLIAWFKENLLPVTESEDNIVFGNASVLPPYSVTDICTENAVVAMQIRSIMEKMPQDFQPK